MGRLRYGFWALSFVAVFLAFGAKAAFAAKRPNVLVILTDDQGWGDLSVHGNTNLSTPNIDSLARDGALFDRFYVCAVCSPTRAEFLTGRYHVRGGVFSTSTGGERLDLDERTIAQVFKKAGYVTAAYGKWHNGAQWPYHPTARGFDDYYGFPSGHWGDYFSPPLEHNGQVVKGDGFIIDDFTNRGIKFIESHKDVPFFLYLPFNTPHSPMQVPDQFYAKFKDADLKLRGTEGKKEKIEHTRAALAMCENIDWNVGRILKALDDTKLADNTIVLYFCDNGPNGARWTGGMRGTKGSTDEGGVRSPLLMRWPGHISAGTKVLPICGAIDLLPSLAELCGVKIDEGKPLDGMSFASLVTGKQTERADRKYFNYWGGRLSVRTQQYRLDNDGKLYDMVADPGQKTDVSAEHADLTAELKSAAKQWRSDVLSELDKQALRPFTVGYREFPITHLPARDGEAHGKIKRSANAPNCSYFTNWINLNDTITWDVDVATSGRYEATVWYTCAEKNLGPVMELSLGDSKTSSKVTQVNDPPALGAEHDREDRGSESYVKDFKPWSLGTLELTKGAGTLTLKCLEKPGSEAIEVRMVDLKLLP